MDLKIIDAQLTSHVYKKVHTFRKLGKKCTLFLPMCQTFEYRGAHALPTYSLGATSRGSGILIGSSATTRGLIVYKSIYDTNASAKPRSADEI